MGSQREIKGKFMVILYALTVMLGGASTALLASPDSLIGTFFAVPLGASLLAVGTAGLVAWRRGSARCEPEVPRDVIWC
jgi:hypothetical protein